MSDTETKRPRGWATAWARGTETKRLVLRALARGDYEAWRDGYLSRRPARHPYDSGPIARERLTRKEFDWLVKHHDKLARRDAVYVLTAFVKRSGRHVGVFDIATILRRDIGWANIGYGVHNHLQGRGYATEAIAAAVAFGLGGLGYHRIEAAVRPDNHPALASARAAGMEHEGLRKKFWLDPDGWADHEIFVAIGT
jgi:[ribosomal protein S5]-alanine N-acetyltransferase